MKTYSKDPYWVTAKFAGPSANKDGQKIKPGDRVFYYPNALVVRRRGGGGRKR